MKIKKTEFEGLFIIEPIVFEDHRGFFMESYNHQEFKDLGVDCKFVQDNQSQSVYGVIRGLHFQNPPHEQAKLIRVLSGKILDVVVDIRTSSPTFGKHFSIELSAVNKKQLFVPRGFAHGFSVLSETADLFYKCDNYYNKESEGGFHYNDNSLNIDWKVPAEEIILSEKDQLLPSFKEIKTLF